MSKRGEPHARGRAFAQCSEELRAPAWLVTAAAGLVHASLFGAALYLSSPSPSLAAKPQARQLLEVELAPPPPPAEEPPPPPPVAEPEPVKLKVAKVALAPTPTEPAPEPEPPKAEETPPPEAAQAAQAITATDNAPAAPSDTLVTGDGAHYAGGTSERGGTATQAAAPNARAGGVPDGTGNAPVDRSQKPRLAGGTDWNCPFPVEAEEDGIDHAVVGLEVEIGADGTVRGVSVHSDPGSGFGREARACALRKRWLPALDRNGQPIQQKHKLNVNFTLR